MRVRRTSCRLGEEHGQSLVELALVMPMLIAIIIGIVDVGWLAYSYVELTNGANAGVHYAAQTYATAGDLNGIKAAVNADAGNLTGITTTLSNVCTCSDGTSGVTCANAATTCVSPARIIDTITVTAKATAKPLFKFPAIPSSMNMQASAT